MAQETVTQQWTKSRHATYPVGVPLGPVFCMRSTPTAIMQRQRNCGIRCFLLSPSRGYIMRTNESRGTRTRDWLIWRDPTAFVNDRPTLSSKRMLCKNYNRKCFVEKRILVVGLKGLGVKKNWLAVTRHSKVTLTSTLVERPSVLSRLSVAILLDGVQTGWIGFIDHLYTTLGTTGNYSDSAIFTLYRSLLHP
jgi:hypothetical protein